MVEVYVVDFCDCGWYGEDGGLGGKLVGDCVGVLLFY